MRKITSAVLTVLLTAAIVITQTPTEPQKPQQEIAPEDIVRITTALVQTDVVVTDKNDQPIPDLKLEDFKLSENGKKQDLKFLEYVSPEGAAHTDGNLKIGNENIDPDVTRNLTAGELRRVFAFVVDDLTVPIADLANVRKLLNDFVDNQMREGDLVAILRVVGGGGLLQQFTSDKRLLRRAISRINPQITQYSAFNNLPDEQRISLDLFAAAQSEGVTFPSEAISDANSNFDVSAQASDRAMRSLMTLRTASEVTNSMKALPGRKSLVLISGGLPLWENSPTQVTIGGVQTTVLETRTYATNLNFIMRQLIDRASRAGVVINTLDVRGLAANGGVSHFTDPGNEATSALFGGNNGGGGAFGRSANMAEFDNLSLDTISGHIGLQALADSTGGVSVTNTNNFREALDRVVAHTGYYLLAYKPTEEFDGKYHRLEVKVNRPGTHVYARAGYVARADEATDKPQTREESIVRAAMSPLAHRQIEVAGRLQYRYLPDNVAQIDINLIFNANNLNFKRDAGGEYTSTFDVVGFMVNNLGKTQGGFSQTVHASLSPAEYKQALAEGISYTGHAELPQGIYQLRAAVREVDTGLLGTFTQYLEVPDLSKKRLTASSLFLYAVNPEPNSKPEPLTAIRELSRSKDLRYAAIVYNPRATNGKSDLRAQVIVSRAGKIIYQEPESPVTASVQEDQLIKIGQLGLGKAQPGRYVLTLVITDPQADKQSRTVIRSTDFTLTD